METAIKQPLYPERSGKCASLKIPPLVNTMGGFEHSPKTLTLKLADNIDKALN
jgi:hypothetical protein